MNAKPLILIVEDEPGIADTLQYALRTDGFDPLWCATGAAALKAVDTLALDAMAPDLVLLDVGLPDINGFELYKKLRETPTLTPHLPIIFLTARSDEIDRVVGLELGADDYVTKPFSPRELVARVRSVLRRVSSNTSGALDGSTKTNPTVTRHGPFTVDEGRRRIRYYQQPVELSRYEYGLLKTLVARPGIVFTRDQLLDMVWDNANDSIDRTVDAHVKTLRAKLKAVAPQLEPIRTHRGTGYALAEDLPSKLS
jgi:two-component system, OmpR family, catabolic regulation response regulator CreB